MYVYIICDVYTYYVIYMYIICDVYIYYVIYIYIICDVYIYYVIYMYIICDAYNLALWTKQNNLTKSHLYSCLLIEDFNDLSFVTH